MGGDGTPLVRCRWAGIFNLDQTEGIQAPTMTATQSASQPLDAAIGENAALHHHAGLLHCYPPKVP
jgi:hypothetical protein